MGSRQAGKVGSATDRRRLPLRPGSSSAASDPCAAGNGFHRIRYFWFLSKPPPSCTLPSCTKAGAVPGTARDVMGAPRVVRTLRCLGRIGFGLYRQRQDLDPPRQLGRALLLMSSRTPLPSSGCGGWGIWQVGGTSHPQPVRVAASWPLCEAPEDGIVSNDFNAMVLQ